MSTQIDVIAAWTDRLYSVAMDDGSTPTPVLQAQTAQIAAEVREAGDADPTFRALLLYVNLVTLVQNQLFILELQRRQERLGGN